MFCSLKYLAVATGFWGIVLSALAFTYSAQKSEFRVLSDREMLYVARGAVPAKTCTTNQLITSFCNDYKNKCKMKAIANCSGVCTGCSNTNVQETICDGSTKPWVYLCTDNSNLNGCGNWYQMANCEPDDNGQCQCKPSSLGGACPQYIQSLNNQGCTRVN